MRKTSNTNLARATAGIDGERVTVFLVHTGPDAEHLGPDDKKRKYSARCVTHKTSTAHATATADGERGHNCPSGPYRP